MKISTKIKKYFPLIILDGYIIFSLLMFRFGTVEWLTPNIGTTILYLIGVYVMFSVGYIVIIKKSYASDLTVYKEFDFFSYGRWIMIIGCVTLITYSIADIIMIYGENTFLFMKHPGAAYDYQESMQKLYSSGNGFEFPMWFRWITRVKTLAYGLGLSALPIGIYYYKRLNITEKILFFALLVVYLLRNWLIGAQSSFFILLSIALTNYFYRLYQCLHNNIEKRKKVRRVVFHTLSLFVVGVLCLLVVFIFQQDRQKQRDIKTQLNTYFIENEIDITDEIWIMNSFNAINLRLGKDIFTLNYEDLIAEQETEQDIENNQVEASIKENVVEDDSLSEELDMNGIGDYYLINKDTSILYKLSPKLFYSIEALELYQTHGYGALGLAFEHDFEWTYMVGNSAAATRFIDNKCGTNIEERTYIYKNQEVYGWSVTTYWQSLYTWLASDFTFIGIIILFGFLGMLFAKVWIETIKYNNPFAFVLMFLMVFGILMASANNLLFQDLGLIIASATIIGIFVLSLIIRRRRVKNIANEK